MKILLTLPLLLSLGFNPTFAQWQCNTPDCQVKLRQAIQLTQRAINQVNTLQQRQQAQQRQAAKTRSRPTRATRVTRAPRVQRNASKAPVRRAKVATNRAPKRQVIAKRPATRRAPAKAVSYGNMSIQQHMILMQMMQQQQMAYGLMSNTMQKHGSMIDFNIRKQAAVSSCAITGNCEVRIMPRIR